MSIFHFLYSDDAIGCICQQLFISSQSSLKKYSFFKFFVFKYCRQIHICTESSDFYIDIVFYNYILKCFVLIDLKTHKLTHQDIRQMDMYIRMFDDLKRQSDDNPTIGIIFCTDKDETMVKYSVLNESEQIFASKYMTVLPTVEELRDELERNQLMYGEELKDN